MWNWILLPFIAAGIGWFTNFLAVRMIFRPHRPIRVLGFELQGLLPKRKKEFAHSIASTVEAHLVSAEDVRAALDDPRTRERFTAMLRERVDHFFAHTLTVKVPMLAPFLKGSLVDTIKASLADELAGLLSNGARLLGDSLDEALDVKAVVERKILDFDFNTLEKIVLDIARAELRWIEILGAILGFGVGLIQLLLLHYFG